MNVSERITMDPTIVCGKPTIRGLRYRIHSRRCSEYHSAEQAWPLAPHPMRVWLHRIRMLNPDRPRLLHPIDDHEEPPEATSSIESMISPLSGNTEE